MVFSRTSAPSHLRFALPLCIGKSDQSNESDQSNVAFTLVNFQGIFTDVIFPCMSVSIR